LREVEHRNAGERFRGLREHFYSSVLARKEY
jgi:hypothetical protein